MSTQFEIVVESTGRDEFRVPGVSVEELREALALHAAVKESQAEVAEERRAALIAAMLVVNVEPLPHASVAQAEKLTRLRERLLASDYHTYESLSELRGDSTIDATRMWVSRMRDKGLLFTVGVGGRAILPVFEFDAEGDARPELGPVLEALAQRGLGPWQTWAWLSTKSPWLDGQRPVDMLVAHPEVVAEAAMRSASNAPA